MIVNLRHKGKAIAHPGAGWSVSFADLESAVDQAVGDLEKRLSFLTTGSKQILTLTMTREPRTIAYLLAALNSGYPLALLSSDWTTSEVSKRRHLLAGSISLDQSDWPPGQVQPSRSAQHRDTRLILFTSGSTGTAKAVELSSKNIESNTAAVIHSLKFELVPEQHLFLDLSYSFGLLGQLIPALHLGITTNLYDMIIDVRAPISNQSLKGMISGVPSQLRLLNEFAEEPTEGVTDLVAAGAYLPIDLRQKLRTKFPHARITSNYGQTEASPRILSIGSEEEEFWTGAVGRTVEGLAHRITTEGELQVSGPQVMLGYLGDSAATDAKIVDGFLNTGDLATEDANGVISIVGRNDDQIKIAGERMNPNEIEATICEVLGISECLVFAHLPSVPEGNFAEPILALVLVETAKLPTAVEIRKMLALNLSKQKNPRLLFKAINLPTTLNGKRQRRNLSPIALNWKKL
jgi:long-chain acyl-CoA synthetase